MPWEAAASLAGLTLSPTDDAAPASLPANAALLVAETGALPAGGELAGAADAGLHRGAALAMTAGAAFGDVAGVVEIRPSESRRLAFELRMLLRGGGARLEAAAAVLGVGAAAAALLAAGVVPTATAAASSRETVLPAAAAESISETDAPDTSGAAGPEVGVAGARSEMPPAGIALAGAETDAARAASAVLSPGDAAGAATVSPSSSLSSSMSVAGRKRAPEAGSTTTWSLRIKSSISTVPVGAFGGKTSCAAYESPAQMRWRRRVVQRVPRASPGMGSGQASTMSNGGARPEGSFGMMTNLSDSQARSRSVTLLPEGSAGTHRGTRIGMTAPREYSANPPSG